MREEKSIFCLLTAFSSAFIFEVVGTAVSGLHCAMRIFK